MTVNRKIKLIPWDAESPEHLDRLVLQRIACGWQAECVPEWKKEQQDGNKMFHWVVRFHLSGQSHPLAISPKTI